MEAGGGKPCAMAGNPNSMVAAPIAAAISPLGALVLLIIISRRFPRLAANCRFCPIPHRCRRRLQLSAAGREPMTSLLCAGREIYSAPPGRVPPSEAPYILHFTMKGTQVSRAKKTQLPQSRAAVRRAWHPGCKDDKELNRGHNKNGDRSRVMRLRAKAKSGVNRTRKQGASAPRPGPAKTHKIHTRPPRETRSDGCTTEIARLTTAPTNSSP